jgi:uncharacterized FlgJ-related protein
MKISRLMSLFLCIVLPVFAVLFLRYVLFPVAFTGQGGLLGNTAVHRLTNADAFIEFIEEYGGDLENVRRNNSVPAVYSENLPVELSTLPVSDKTALFITLVLPNVLRVNEEIRDIRQQMEFLFAKKENYRRLTRKEQWWLNRLAWDFGCDPEDRQEMRLRVDTVPVALALAQAIDESGWGTSRFALAGNALYGQHLPSDSEDDYILSRHGNVKVAAFDSIYAATRSYIHKLNSVWAYDDLRQMRASLREQGLDITGHELASGLESYSALGKDYVHDLRYLIERYELEYLNGVELQGSGTGMVVEFLQ